MRAWFIRWIKQSSIKKKVVLPKKESFDIFEDWSEIEASFQSEYNIDLSRENFSWRRFIVLLNNLSNECSLGRLIYIRNYKPINNLESERRRVQHEMLILKNKRALRRE